MAACNTVLPSCASDFRVSTLDLLCISYKEVNAETISEHGEAGSGDSAGSASKHLYKWFFKNVGKLKPGDTEWWQSLDLFVENRKRRIHSGKLHFSIDETDSTHLDEIFQRGCAPRSSDDSTLLEKLRNLASNAVKNAGCSRTSSYDRNEYESLGKVINFLSVLEEMFCKILKGSLQKKAHFINLFTRFANLCLMNVSPGATDTRAMTILGTKVTSMPDLQYGARGKPNMPLENEFLVVTVGESKAGQRDEFLQSEDEPEPAKKCKLDEDSESYESKLKGQHGAELLLELPFSAMRGFGNHKVVFGLIVQATKVQLTCLEMTSEHLRKIRTNETLGTERASIYYTRAYNVLNVNDREELEGVLLTLSYLANDYSKF